MYGIILQLLVLDRLPDLLAESSAAALPRRQAAAAVVADEGRSGGARPRGSILEMTV